MAIHRIYSRRKVSLPLPLLVGLAMLCGVAQGQTPPRDNPLPNAANPQPSAITPRPTAPKSSATPQLPTTPGTETSGEFKQQLQEQNEATVRTASQLNRDAQQEARQVVEAQRGAAAAVMPGSNQATVNADVRAIGNGGVPAIRAADMGVWFRNEPGTRGLVVADLAPTGAFVNAGLREGDVISALNGLPITSEAQFVQLLHSPNAVSSLANVVVLRNGQPQTLSIQPAAVVQGMVAYDPFFQAGLTIDPSNSEQAVIQQVFPRTPAYYAGLRAGDVITAADGNRIASPAALARVFQNRGDMLVLQVSRNGQLRHLSLERGPAHLSNPVVGTEGPAPGGANTTSQIDRSGLNTAGGVSAAGGTAIGTTVPGNTAGSTLLPSTSAPLGPAVNPGQIPGRFSGLPNAIATPAPSSSSVGGTGSFPGGAGSTAGPSGRATAGGGVGAAGAAAATGAGAGGSGTAAGASGTASGTPGGAGPGAGGKRVILKFY